MGDKKLYIYYDHKFKCYQVVKVSKFFNGNWRELAEAVAGVDRVTGKSNAYKWIAK